MVNMHLFRIMEYAREHFPKDYTRVVAAAATFIDGDLAYQRERGFLLPEEGRATEEVHRERFVYIGRQEKQYFRPSASVFHVGGWAEHGFCHGRFFFLPADLREFHHAAFHCIGGELYVQRPHQGPDALLVRQQVGQ